MSFVRQVQLQITSGNTVEDAVNCIVDFYKGKESDDSGVVSEEGIDSSIDSEEESDGSDIKEGLKK